MICETNSIEVQHEGQTFSLRWHCISMLHTDHKLLLLALSEKELEMTKRFRHPSRTLQFAAGRYCAKRAIPGKEDEPLSGITIGTGVWGQPYVHNAPLNISIAHTHSKAIAICTPPALPVGVDIEELDAKNDPLIQSQLTHLEKALSAEYINQSAILHIMWAAKESAAKVLKTGFRLPMALFEISQIEEQNNKFHIQFATLELLTAVVMVTSFGILALALPSKAKITDDSLDVIHQNLITKYEKKNIA